MKLQLGELRGIIETLPKIIQKKLPVKTSYWLQRAFVDITKEFKIFEDARKKLIEDTHGKRYEKDKKDKAGKIIEKKGELVLIEDKETKASIYMMKDMKAFNDDYTKLAEEGIEIKFEPISIENFIVRDNDGKEINGIEGSILLGLGRLIKEE